MEKLYDITIDARMINHSGIGTYIKNMIPDLVKSYKIALLGSREKLVKYGWANETEIIETDFPIYSISEQLFIPGLIPESRLFITPHYNVPLGKIPAAKRISVIHDVNHLVFIDQLSIVKKVYARYMINSAIKKSDKILTVSSFSKNEILKYTGIPEQKLKVIHCGLDIGEIAAMAEKITLREIRDKYLLPEEYYVYVGSSKPHKNLITALKAFSKFEKKYTGKKLLLVGVKKDHFYKNEEYLKFSNFVELPGYITDTDLPAVYKNATALVFPSVYEGFGLPPIEAMCCGCPVISSNSASLPEVCGNAVLFFDPFETEQLEYNLIKVENDKKIVTQLIDSGYMNIKRFDRNIFSEKLKEEFDSIIFP